MHAMSKCVLERIVNAKKMFSSQLDDCCQLVKANSIEGNKMNNIGIVYTMWSNLKKTGDMAVGQVR